MLSLGFNSTPLFSLVTWGNAWLQYDLPMSYSRNSCFRPWRDNGQVLGGLDGKKRRPLAWLKHVQSESRLLGLRHRSDPAVTARIKTGDTWAISVHGAGKTSLIASPLHSAGRFAPELLWSGEDELPPVRVPLDEAEAALRTALQAGLDFTRGDNWSDLFQSGLNALDGTQDLQCLGDNITPRVHVGDLMPTQYYEPRCWCLLGASLITLLPWAGMGGWSGYDGPRGTIDGWARAGEIGTRLREARLLAALSVLNLHSR